MANREPLQFDFWNVGQGDATSITLPTGELILIDVGPRGSTLARWLATQSSARVRDIVLTHNDADHAGALSSVLTALDDRAPRVLMLEDRERSAPVAQRLFRLVLEKARHGNLRLERLEIAGGPKILWRDAETDLALVIRHPDYAANLERRSPNDSSGILSLDRADRPLICWGGDAPLSRIGNVCPQSPAVLFGPHHGAPIDHERRDFGSSVDRLSPASCFLSLGTHNQHGHPKLKYVRGLARNDAYVMCSQLTNDCDRRHITANRHVLNTNGYFGLPAPAGVYCRGHVRMTVTEKDILEDRYADRHREAVQALHRPKCRAN